MRVFHTSPKEITEVKKYNGVFDSVLFFSDNEYYMNNDAKFVYSVDLSESDIIDVFDLEITESQAVHIACVLDIDVEAAYDAVCSNSYEYQSCEDSWWIQAEQARIAKSMGYFAKRGRRARGLLCY